MKRAVPPKKLGREHTGKLRHHRHTSYGSLMLILLLMFVPVFMASRSVASAATSATDKVEGSYQTYAVVPGAVITEAPTISSPSAGQIFNNADAIEVRGTCTNRALVKLFKNQVLAGAALCQNGNYRINIDLFLGTNNLVARDYNANDVPGPDSKTVQVELALAGNSQTGGNTIGGVNQQFYITSNISHRGVNAGDEMTWPLIIGGGQGPYAVSVSWGDGKTDLYSRSNAETFDLKHIFDKAAPSKGGYTIFIKATDQAGNRSLLQLVAIVSGDQPPVGVVGSVSGGYSNSTMIKFAWQALAVLVLVVFSFWLGERRELGILKRSQARTV